MYHVMAQQRHPPNEFPTRELVDQCNRTFKASIPASAVQVTVFKSRKHATAGILIVDHVRAIVFPFSVPFIAKQYNVKEISIMNREREVLAQALRSGIPVPRVLSSLDTFLLLEKVEGTTLMDLVNSESDFTVKEEAIKNLATWLCRFHQAFESHPAVKRRGDANLRNFIVNERNAIIGLDFEEASPGSPITDLHEVVDSILQSRPGIYSDGMPAIDWKFDLCESLLRNYAVAARKPPIEIIKDHAGFIDTQLRVMRELAAIRGTKSLMMPLIPVITKKIEGIIERLLHDDRPSIV
jgi:aminoglycoside phosphotransferase (APT) family kinase protein